MRGPNVGLDAACPEPARQPETIPAGLEGDCNAFDLVSCLLRFLSPSMQNFQQCVLVDSELVQRLALDASTMPAISQLDWPISITAISVLFRSQTDRDRLRSFGLRMGCSIGSHQRRWMQSPRRPPHSVFFGALDALAIDDAGGGNWLLGPPSRGIRLRARDECDPACHRSATRRSSCGPCCGVENLSEGSATGSRCSGYT